MHGAKLRLTDVHGDAQSVWLELSEEEASDAVTRVTRRVGSGLGLPKKGGGRGELYAEVRLVGHPKLDLVRLEQGKAIDHLQLVQTLKTALERQQAAAATRSAPMGGAVETQADRHVRYRAARYSR